MKGENLMGQTTETPDVPAPGEPEITWARVEIMGHRCHYGRTSEVQRFGATMLRIDVPVAGAVPLLGETEQFQSVFYGGASIFSFTPMTEEACRKRLEQLRPSYVALPAPQEDDYGPDDEGDYRGGD